MIHFAAYLVPFCFYTFGKSSKGNDLLLSTDKQLISEKILRFMKKIGHNRTRTTENIKERGKEREREREREKEREREREREKEKESSSETVGSQREETVVI